MTKQAENNKPKPGHGSHSISSREVGEGVGRRFSFESVVLGM
ncbi:MAG TPA: hypothetical protein VMW53_07675 [archaeon]|nr:hypothetical protein [archaeon]